MPFQNPIVAGTELVRASVHSPDYAAGVAGWSLNRDGSAEFSDATVRGTIDAAQIDGGTINGADINGGTIDGAQITGGDLVISGGGASVHIGVDEIQGADVELSPAPIPGHTIQPAVIHTISDDGAFDTTTMRLLAPKLDALGAAFIDLSTGTDPGHIGIELNGAGNRIRIAGASVIVTASGSGTIQLNAGDPSASSLILRNGDSLLPNAEIASVNIALTKAATSTAYGTITGLSFSFTKHYSDTRLIGYLSVGGFLTGAGSSSFEFAIRINSVDHSVFIFPINPIGEQFFRSGEVEIPAASVPAGSYTVTCRWRGTFGAGTLDAGGNKYIMRLMEVAP